MSDTSSVHVEPPTTPASDSSGDQVNAPLTPDTTSPEAIDDSVTELTRNDELTTFESPIPFESCLCIVCVNCVYGLKIGHKHLPNNCLCKNNEHHLVILETTDAAMETYRRSHTMEWVNNNSNDNTEYQVNRNNERNLITPPPDEDDNQEQINRDEFELNNYLYDGNLIFEGLGIFSANLILERLLDVFEEPVTEHTETACTYRFYNWIEDRPRNIRSLENFPEEASVEHILIFELEFPSTFGDLFRGYFDMLGYNNAEFLNLMFYDPISREVYSGWKDMKQVFISDGILNRIFNVGLYVVNYKELFVEK